MSEGLGLTWKGIDFSRKILRISHSLLMKKQDNFEIYGDTKTENSLRVITLDDDTVKILKEWKKVQAQHGLTQLVMSLNDKP